MSQKHRITDAVVGAFVLLAAAGVVGATLWARQADVGRHRATVTARFRDVGNATVGSGVFIRGVRAGRISSLELDDDGWVEARIALEPDVRLPTDPVVVLGASSLFGEWQATITPRTAVPEHPDVRRQLAETSGGGRGVLPGATLPDVAQLTTVAGRIADDMGAVASRFRVAFDDKAAVQLRATISNTSELSQVLAQTARRQSTTVDQVAANLETGTRALAEAAAAVRRTTARGDSATASGDLQQAVADAASAARTLSATAADLRAIVQRTSTSQERLDRTLAHAEALLARANSDSGSLARFASDPSLYRNADSLLVEFRTLLADVKANPRKYVHLKLF